MKMRHTALTGLFAATFWVSASALALPINDTVDPAETFINFGITPSPCPSGFNCTASNLSFTHNITDNGFLAGLQTISSATIAVHLSDEGSSENYSILIGDALQTVTVANLGSNVVETIPLDATALADLAADGMITVRVRSNSGSFSFADSILTAQVAGVTSSVPEPSSLLLLAIGLTGLSLRARSSKRAE
jgi:hypothetical protein